ncbi:uracil-DNA glycosylase family protein [Nitrosomonas sp.]|uniref:uracil-DNA glycosylase n=1 Tax=Nitrosomonas sp. TaxID=42353 RepID=UPI00208C22F2|nr:uracil-DNA glycosylase [Nitrosomonas sp.]GJL75104.1 MAG: uracil-DNA glycosylase [Nitrosomonas sp.]
MNTRRKIILKELGLSPLWRLRSEAAAHQAPPEIIVTEQAKTDAPMHVDKQKPEIGQMDWEQLASTVANCTACPLRQTCTQTVFGVGDKNADWIYIGEGPGAREDAVGEPFVGQAGKLLDNMLAAIQLKRGHNVYITNIVKCRPPNNRNPSEDEARQCAPYLARQIELIKPKLIVALGKVAAQNLLDSHDSIANLRGKIHSYSGIPLIVTYHPAYLLRALPEKAKAWQDLCTARELMRSLS